MSRQRNFLEAIVDKKVPVTCRYWLNGRCYNSTRCSYLHGYVCRNDGDCRSPDCSDIHWKQRDPTHSRPRRHSRSRSRSMSPRFRHRRNYKSPPRGKNSRGYGPSRSHSRSPRRRVGRSRSRSPKRRFSRSPRRYSRSRTKSPRRRNSRSFSRGRSRSPRHQSRSPQFERRSPAEFQEKSQFQPQSRFENVGQEFLKNSCSFERTREMKEVDSPLEVEDVIVEEGSRASSKLVVLDDIEDGQIITPERQPECVVLDESGDELICPTDEEVEVLKLPSRSQLPNKIPRRPRREPSISELTDRIASDFMKPETQALLQNILKLTTEESSSKTTKEGSASPDPLITEKILDEMAVDLEEVGEEVDDYFGSTAEVEPSLEDHVKVAANPSPPKALDKRQSDVRTRADYHTDWELKMALENPEKPLEKAVNIPLRPPPVEKNRGNKSNSSSLWTPALDRRQVSEAKLKMAYQAGKSNWEVETPYIARNTKKDSVQLGPAPTFEQNGKPTQAEFKNPTVKQGRSSEGAHIPAAPSKKEPSPCEAAPLKIAEETDSSKVLPVSEKKPQEEMEILAKEKATLLNEIKMLESQRSILQDQKSSMIRSHKGDKKSLDELLEENLFLYDKIGKEIKKRSDKVLKLNVTLIKAMKISKVRKAERSQSKSPDSGHRLGMTSEDHYPFKSRMVKPKDKESPEHPPRFRSLKRTRDSSRSPECSTSKRERDYSRSPERRSKKHAHNYSRSPEQSLSKFVGNYFRSPERIGAKLIHGYSRSPERNTSNRVRDYSRSPERGASKHVRNYSRSPEKNISKRGREYSSRSPDRNASKRNSDYSRSPDRSSRRRSPTHRSHRSPKNSRSVRSPRRNGGRSRSPDNDYKRPSSPESSRSKLVKSTGPALVKIQKSHWARSHIKGTLEKFKKELFAEVDVPYSPNEKPKAQDEANVDTCEVPESRLGHANQPEKEVVKDLKKLIKDDSVECKFNTPDEDERIPFFGETGKDGPFELDRIPQPGASQSKSQYRVMDVGMHWCRLCDQVFETLPMYCNHLLSSSHLARLKNNPKPWLARATKEEKKPLPPDVKTITLPILGSEFFHSLPVVYCSLCNVFLRDVAEAVKHPECEFHIASYKVEYQVNSSFCIVWNTGYKIIERRTI
ncbi:bcl-2-associated transcription factor 1-like [Palaemon carinicauda]|uniref:bcl-2-associated transcription factor 1-like n=1 Tax=Palaemon carinicauda TaxID=392227 RepID=UPI0035B67D10